MTRASPTIVVDQPVALFDAPIAIVLEHLVPGTSATITATSEMWGRVWRSEATFVADGAGRAELTRDAPVTGTYSGPSAMGLFWSAAPLPGAPQPIPSDWAMQPSIVRLEARSADRRAEMIVERRLAGVGVTRRLVRKGGVVGTLFLPPGDGPRPTVMVLGGSDGMVPEHRAALVASHGYAGLALAYFRAPGLPRQLSNIPLEYFENAIHWMRAQLASIDLYESHYPAARDKLERALALRQAIGNRVGEAATFYQLGVLAHRLGPTEAGARLVAVCWLINDIVGHADAESDLRELAGLCGKAGLDKVQIQKLFAEVAEAYVADRGRSLIERAFNSDAGNATASGSLTVGGRPPRPPRGPGLLRRLWEALRRGGGARGG